MWIGVGGKSRQPLSFNFMPIETKPMAADGEASDQGIHIAAEQLPAGISEGDCLRCTGMDESGCTFTLEKGEGAKESWESDLRKEMSPTAPQEGAE